MAEKHLKAVKRFGARYGRTTKLKVGKIESQQRATHTCPYCHYTGVKRVSLGIWNCKKCGATFTGKAYTPGKPTTIEEKKQQIVPDIPEDVDKKEEEEVYDDEDQEEEQPAPVEQPTHSEDSEDFGEEPQSEAESDESEKTQ